MRKDLILVAVLVTILALMIVPLNPALIDVLIGLNITLAIMLLLVAIYIKRPSDFATFPSVILIGTAFRLALSIGTTRLILADADAGAIIATFGEFVVSGSVAIGLVIFLIITVVQFLVVTKGAERVAEVGARFALDALPGKQMSIDADLRAGNIEQEEAIARRAQLDKNSQFFGAMDGAMKFVKGDAIAGLIIIVINMVAGISVGVSIHGFTFSEAFTVFTLLTVGDGLVAQIPALLMSLCAGIIVTRATNDHNTDLGSDIIKELVADMRVPGVASVLVIGFGLIPGFPFYVFAGASAFLMGLSLVIRRAFLAEEKRKQDEAATAEVEVPESEEVVVTDMPTSNRIGIYLSQMLRDQLDMDVFVSELHSMIAFSNGRSGISFPSPFVIIEDMLGEGAVFSIVLDEVPLQRETIPTDSFLAPCDSETLKMCGCYDVSTRVDWQMLDAYWVPSTFQDALADIGVHALELERALPRLLFRSHEQQVGTLFSKVLYNEWTDKAREFDAAGLQEVEDALSAQGLFLAFRYLIEDGVPLRPVNLVVDGLLHWIHANDTINPVSIAECMRGTMKRQMCDSIANKDGILGIVMLDQDLQSSVQEAIVKSKQAGTISMTDGLPLPTSVSDRLVSEISRLERSKDSIERGHQLVIVVPMAIRRRLRNFLASHNINTPVLGSHEISKDVQAYPIEIIKAETVKSDAGLRAAQMARDQRRVAKPAIPG